MTSFHLVVERIVLEPLDFFERRTNGGGSGFLLVPHGVAVRILTCIHSTRRGRVSNERSVWESQSVAVDPDRKPAGGPERSVCGVLPLI